MVLFVLAFLGGVLTILSPCILPVLPFVFTRTGEPFMRSGLPLLVGMAVTFAVVATLAAVGGGWVVQANQWGRWIALALDARVRSRAAAAAPRGSAEPARSSRSATGSELGCAARRRSGLVAVARRCDGHAVGAVRGPDPRA